MKNPTRKTLSKVTMYMMTTMTTVQRLVLRIVWSFFPFPLYTLFVCRVFFGHYSVVASSLVRLYDNVLVSAVSPFSRKKGRKSSVICFSVEFFHVRLRVSLMVHAHLILLILEVAAPRLFRDCASARILRNILLFVSFFRFCRLPIASTYLIILQC